MKSDEHIGSQIGSAFDLPRSYLSGLEVVAKLYEPLLKGIGRCSLEGLALMSRRSQAWLAYAGRLGKYQSPADLATSQWQFWQAATLDYLRAAQRLTAAFGVSVTLPEHKGIAQRDFITVEEPPTAAGKRSDRKAA
jgi:hypothetical protein